MFDFGDGTPPVTISSPIISHIYENSGSYEVIVILSDKYGHREIETATVVITNLQTREELSVAGSNFVEIAQTQTASLPNVENTITIEL